MSTRIALSERINTPISTAELERRWGLVRRALEVERIDVLLVHSPHEMAGGHVRWLADVAVTDQPITIVFPRDEAMTLVTHGPFGGDETVAPEGNSTLRGVRRILTTPMFPAAGYTGGYVAGLLERALAPYANATIGLLGGHLIPYATLEPLRRAFPGATFVDATDLIEPIKVVKSEEEQVLIRRAAHLQDAVMEATLSAIIPGMRDSDVTAVARRVGQELGSESGILLCGSAPADVPAMIGNLHMQHRVIEAGDVIALLVEVNGPGGYYAELGRLAVLGPAPEQLLAEYAFGVETQQRTVDQLRAGASPRSIWDDHNAWMREHGLPEEGRIHCHGQGYDFVERPLIRSDESMPIEAGMNITCHPSYTRNGIWSWTCDNFLVSPEGPPEPLHAFPRQVIEL